MSQPSRKTLMVVSLIVIGVMVLGLSAALFSDLPTLGKTFHEIKVQPLLFALICTSIAYLSFTLSFNGLFVKTPYRIPFNKFFSIMFISYTINFIVSSGGWAGIALRAFLLKHHKVPYSVTIPLSFAQNMVFNLVLVCVSFGGMIYLREHPEVLGGGKEVLVFLFMMSLILVVALMLLVFFHSRFRRWFLRRLIGLGNWVNHWILRRRSDLQGLVKLRNSLETTIRILNKDWGQLLVVFFWVSMDWTFTALTLYFCFHAVGVHLPLGLLMLGFTVMFLTSNINPVPAGLGISEVALAGVFKLLGVKFELTLIAALLFRFIFFLIPLAVSTALYLDTIRSFLKSEEAIEVAVKNSQP